MKNRDKWRAKRFTRDSKGRIIGSYNHKIIGNAYESVIKKHASGRLADVGCGDVPYYLFYKEIIEDVVCIDWENISLDDSHLDFVADLNQPIPEIESNSFDTVLCTDVLEHLYNPSMLMSEMSRILKPGGKLILSVPFLYWLHEQPHDYHRYTKYMLQKFCEQRNLTPVLISEYGGLPEILFDMVFKGVTYFNFPLKSMILKIWLGIGLVSSKLSIIKRLSNVSKSTFPMGYIMVAEKQR